MTKVKTILKLFSTLAFLQFASTQMLNKTFCKLSGLKIEDLEMSSSWQIIDLSHNSIMFIDFPELLRKQNSLETLRLNFNQDFNGRGNEQIFAHKTLRSFECKECGFTEIQSQHFAGLVSLNQLYLNANRISRIDKDAFKSNENLKLVDLSNNELRSLPYSVFAGIRSLEALFLTSNHIELPKNKPFIKSDSLKFLRMDDCHISSIYSETFNENLNLETLNLNRNQIESLPVNSFKSNSKLKSLFVESNQMRFFSGTIVDFLDHLKELCIDNNTFVESPDMVRFVKKYDKQKLRTKNCNDNVKFFIENLFIEVFTDVPEDNDHNSTEKSSKFVKAFINEGVSDFFIGSYITLIIILQALAFILLAFYLLKITKYEKLDGEVNYANTILNDDEIYRVYKSNQ